jgi:hypothetical protein
MIGFRRRLSWVLYTWIACQAVGLAIPIALAASGVVSIQICTCPGEDHGATCPMHHGKSASAKDEELCSLQSATRPLDAALLSMAGGAGVLPQLVASAPLQPAVAAIAVAAAVPQSWTEVPNSPPPRS